MRLENVLALTHGKLINQPFVSDFNNVVFESKSIKRGDLFIAFNEWEIEDAVLNGAYGVVFSKPTQIYDHEIAWIKVENIDNALKRILRFLLINKDVKAYECNEIILKLALQVITDTNFIVLDGDIRSIFKSLYALDTPSTLLFSSSFMYKDVFTKTMHLSDNVAEKINIIEQTLFETSFIYDNVFYERQLLSPFFIPFLEILLHLFKTLKINYRLRKFIPIEHFEAVFTNKNFEIKEFGTSDKVLIFEKNSAYIEKEIEFLHKETPWAKTLYIIPEKYLFQKSLYDTANIITYKNENEILKILKNNIFHFALITGVDKSILSRPLMNNRLQMNLFDFK